VVCSALRFEKIHRVRGWLEGCRRKRDGATEESVWSRFESLSIGVCKMLGADGISDKHLLLHEKVIISMNKAIADLCD